MIKRNWFDYLNVILMTIAGIVTLFPLYYIVIISVADYAAYASSPVYLFPKSFDISAYKMIFKTNYVGSSLSVSVTITIISTLLSLVVTTLAAYPLSKREIPGVKVVFGFIIATMFLNGGLIPYYLTIKSLNLIDTLAALILPAAVNTFNLIILKNNFETVPASLEEAAKIDGANDIVILIKIVLPTCKAILATIALFYAVERWNEWYFAMLFIIDKGKRPLQLVLREVLFNSDMVTNPVGQQLAASKSKVYSEGVKMATVVVATIPIICVYPFLQKYYTKGIMIGSIKE